MLKAVTIMMMMAMIAEPQYGQQQQQQQQHSWRSARYAGSCSTLVLDSLDGKMTRFILFKAAKTLHFK